MGQRNGHLTRSAVCDDVAGAERRKVDAGLQIGSAAEQDLPVPDLVPFPLVIGLDNLLDPVFHQTELLHGRYGLDFLLQGGLSIHLLRTTLQHRNEAQGEDGENGFQGQDLHGR